MPVTEREVAEKMLESAEVDLAKDIIMEMYFQRRKLAGQKMDEFIPRVQTKIKEGKELVKFLQEKSK